MAGRQGGGKEITRDECYSETKKNRIWGMSPAVKLGMGHLAPEVKVASEICDHVWDKLYPPFL
jgi:hypothetical protein